MYKIQFTPKLYNRDGTIKEELTPVVIDTADTYEKAKYKAYLNDAEIWEDGKRIY